MKSYYKTFALALIFLQKATVWGQSQIVDKYAENLHDRHKISSFSTPVFTTVKSPQKFTAAAFKPLKNGLVESKKTELKPQYWGNISKQMVLQYSFFCRQEWLLEKKTTIPFRIRLGSLAYTDYLEQKPNALKPY